MPAEKRREQVNVARGQRNGKHGEHAATKRQSERHQLVSQVGTVVAEAPDSIQGYFERKEHSCRSH